MLLAQETIQIPVPLFVVVIAAFLGALTFGVRWTLKKVIDLGEKAVALGQETATLSKETVALGNVVTVLTGQVQTLSDRVNWLEQRIGPWAASNSDKIR